MPYLLGLSLTLQLLSARVALAQVTPAPEQAVIVVKQPKISVQTPLEAIKAMNAYYAKKYGNDVGVMEEVLRCESNFKQSAVGDKGNAKGIAQFWRDTFERFKEESGLDVDYNSMEGQVELMNWAMANDYGSHWTCLKKVVVTK